MAGQYRFSLCLTQDAVHTDEPTSSAGVTTTGIAATVTCITNAIVVAKTASSWSTLITGSALCTGTGLTYRLMYPGPGKIATAVNGSLVTATARKYT